MYEHFRVLAARALRVPVAGAMALALLPGVPACGQRSHSREEAPPPWPTAPAREADAAATPPPAHPPTAPPPAATALVPTQGMPLSFAPLAKKADPSVAT